MRFIGKITNTDLNGQLTSSGYLQVKGKSNYSEMNMKLEGIGEDTYALRDRTKDSHGAWSEWAYRSLTIDTVAPVTTDDAPNGWVNKDVTVNFMASDMDSGVAVTYYTMDNGAPQTGQSVTITSEGIHSLTYWSVDHAGNVEEKKTVSIQLDKTGPTLQVELDQTILKPANNKPVSVTAFVDSSDSLSGIDSVVLSSIIPSELDDASEPLVGDATYDTLDQTFTLLAKKANKKADLIYSITYTAWDKAGNQTVTTVTVRVPHNQSEK